MAKVLISFVGTGPLINKGAGSSLMSAREYRRTTYHLGDEDLGEYPFTAAALSDYYDIDKIILIGTAHSMWEEVYRFFKEKKCQVVDEQVYCDIAEYCEHATSESALSLPHIEQVEQALGSNAHIALIKYGVNEAEINENISIVLQLHELFSTGDELIVDVTHSFRSLPILVMNLLLYINNVSMKHIKLSHIYYGMVEMIKEYGYAPIVDLKKVMELNKWIMGANSFKEYGKAYQISELLKGVDTDASTRLKHFSDVMNLNHIFAISRETKSIKTILKKDFPSLLPQMIVKPVVKEFVKSFQNTENDPALFQLKLAEWQYKHMNYAAALISLQESILTYACMVTKHDSEDKDERNAVKDQIFKAGILPEELKKVYSEVTAMRNVVAHALEKDFSVAKIIDTIRTSLEIAEKYIDKSMCQTLF